MVETVREEGLPTPVAISLDGDLRSYWIDRVTQHFSDTYAGVRISKFPEDLRTYEHLLWQSCADVVIELGVQFGGSTLWLRDRLDAMARYGRISGPTRVIGVDLEIAPAREALGRLHGPAMDGITLLEGDVTDPQLAARVQALVPPGARCLVIEDSGHIYDTTRAALELYSHLVPVGGYFVVEDGCVDVDEMRLSGDWPRGVLPALTQWLGTAQGSAFAVRRDLECYGLSCHPHGFLQRTR